MRIVALLVLLATTAGCVGEGEPQAHLRVIDVAVDQIRCSSEDEPAQAKVSFKLWNAGPGPARDIEVHFRITNATGGVVSQPGASIPAFPVNAEQPYNGTATFQSSCSYDPDSTEARYVLEVQAAPANGPAAAERLTIECEWAFLVSDGQSIADGFSRAYCY